MINSRSGIKKYIQTILLFILLVLLIAFMVSELNSEASHFTSVIHRPKIYQQEDDHNVIVQRKGDHKIKIIMNSEWQKQDGSRKNLYSTIFQADPIEDWNKKPQKQIVEYVDHKQFEEKRQKNNQNANKELENVPTGIRAKAGISVRQALDAKKYLIMKEVSQNSELVKEEKEYFQDKYSVSQYPQLPICVVIPSFNNVDQNRYINNMKSIIQQEYSNYHIVFIDDASDDGTGKHMQQWADQHNITKQKLRIIINEERSMAMPNIYKAAKEYCEPYQIFIIIDGDDELIGRQVFKHFNQIFSTKDVWLAYTNFITVKGNIGYSRPFNSKTIENNKYRQSAFVISHLRAFYTKLLTNVNITDLKDMNGNWYRAANDVAMYLPILEMCHQKIVYVPEISYLYNSNTGLNNHRTKLKEQKNNQKLIKKKSRYQPLEQLFTNEEKEAQQQKLNAKIPLYSTMTLD